MYVAVIPSRVQIDSRFEELMAAITAQDLVEAYNDDPRRPQNLIEGFCKQTSIKYIEALDHLQKVTSEEGIDLKYVNDGHFNARGTRELAKVLVKGLQAGLSDR